MRQRAKFNHKAPKVLHKEHNATTVQNFYILTKMIPI